MVDFERRVSAASERQLQCVPSFGLVRRVLRINVATFSSGIERGRPERSSSCNPVSPCFTNRLRQRPTVTWFNRNRPAMSLLDKPSALSKMIRTRVTRPWGSERELAIASSCSRCSRSSCNGARGRPKFIGTSILHRRCLRGKQSRKNYISYLRDTTLAFDTRREVREQELRSRASLARRRDSSRGVFKLGF